MSRNNVDSDLVKQLIARFANSFDLKAWDELNSCLAPEVFTDYRGLRGTTPETMERERYVTNRSKSLARLFTHHLLGNIEVTLTGSEAQARASGVIYRKNDAGKVFDTHCIYEFGMLKSADVWVISAITQRVLWNEGSADIHSGVQTGEAGY